MTHSAKVAATWEYLSEFMTTSLHLASHLYVVSSTPASDLGPLTEWRILHQQDLLIQQYRLDRPKTSIAALLTRIDDGPSSSSTAASAGCSCDLAIEVKGREIRHAAAADRAHRFSTNMTMGSRTP